MTKTLVIVPCGSAKVWDRDPSYGPTPAQDAYTGFPFRVNREYAERFGDSWVILSAKYGFIRPDFIIPEPYNVTFNRRSLDTVRVERIREQIHELGLDAFRMVVGLGGRHYREMIQQAFASFAVQLQFPFAGLPLGRSIQATRRAIRSGPDGLLVRATTRDWD